jgi:exonuclease 3'-5' domain-containing protein 1
MPTPNTVLVDTYDTLHACLEDVERIPAPASIVVDLEGVYLGRRGRIAIMQLHAQHSNTVWLIDVTTLGARAFDEACSRGKTLRGLLEGMHIRKVSRLLVLAARVLAGLHRNQTLSGILGPQKRL